MASYGQKYSHGYDFKQNNTSEAPTDNNIGKSEHELIYITITSDSTDYDIDRMSFNNMCSEIFQMTSLSDLSLTLERIKMENGHIVST